MKIIVIGGGGNRGASGGGKIERLNRDYDKGIGISTGALLLPLTLLKKYDKLKEGYTNITPKDVWKINPFTRKGNIRWHVVAWRAITGKTSMGDSSNLKILIKKFFTIEDFWELRALKKEAIVAVQNLTLEQVEYKSSLEETYENFTEWMYISACFPLAMNITHRDGYDYIDAGVSEVVGLEEAVRIGADEIDVIAHRPKNITKLMKRKTKNMPELAFRVFEIMRHEISNDDIEIGKKEAECKGIKCNIHYLRYGFNTPPLLFEKNLMTRWWKLAYNEKDPE